MFIDKEEFKNLPYLERNKDWLSYFSKFNSASAIFEFFSTSVYAGIFFMNINISKNWIVSMVFSVVLAVLSTVIIAWIVSSQRVAIRKLFGSFDTKPKIDDVIYTVAIIATTAFLIFSGKEGDKIILNTFNSYDPTTQNYTENKDYNEKKTRKDDVKTERENAISEAKSAAMNCAECKIIEGRYSKKITDASKGKITRFKPNEANWAASVNGRINSNVKNILEERDGLILEARGRAEAKRDSIVDSYDNRVSSADTEITVHQNKIDSTNIAEFRKKEERENANTEFAGYLIIFTQILFFVGAGGQAFMYRKANKVWHDVEQLLGAADFTAPIFVVINIGLSKVAESIKLWISKFMAREAVRIIDNRNKAFSENSSVQLMYEHKVTTVKQAEWLISKGISLPTPIIQEILPEQSSIEDFEEAEHEEAMSFGDEGVRGSVDDIMPIPDETDDDFEPQAAQVDDENISNLFEEKDENVNNSDGTLSEIMADNSEKISIIEQVVKDLKMLIIGCDQAKSNIIEQTINDLIFLKNSL